MAYPLLAHAAVMEGSSALEWLALSALLASFLYPGLAVHRVRSWALLVAGSLALGCLDRVTDQRLALAIPPLTLLAATLAAFALSLRAGCTPLVTRLARAIADEPLPEGAERYTRRVTWIWVVALAALLVATAGLTVAGSSTWWSLQTNFINYAVIALVFLIEYRIRRRRFPGQRHPPLSAQLRRLVANRPLSLRA